MKCYLINLDRAPERLARMTAILESFDIPFERVPATDAKQHTFNERAVSSKTPSGQPALVGGDIACGFSHVECLTRIVEGSDQYAAILEDDLHLASDIKSYLNSAEWIPEGSDIIKLETFDEPTLLGPSIKKMPVGRIIAPLLKGHFGAVLYIISRDAARRILQEFDPEVEYIDVYLFETILERYRVYQVSPAPAIQDNIGGFKSATFLTSGIAPDRRDQHVVKYRGWAKTKRETKRVFSRICYFGKIGFLRLTKGQRFGKVRYRA
ncbi:glycosyl transferase family protein [Brucella sp. NF 2653]|nr:MULTISPECIES: glycosyltransferase family 25 protein [unclassified Brucella]EEZ33924.1 glycosyl transferase [Brucella sp. 83/13]EFM61769.1 glycosyl transferase family protein [Brucella sp. NF 2653]